MPELALVLFVLHNSTSAASALTASYTSRTALQDLFDSAANRPRPSRTALALPPPRLRQSCSTRWRASCRRSPARPRSGRATSSTRVRPSLCPQRGLAALGRLVSSCARGGAAMKRLRSLTDCALPPTDIGNYRASSCQPPRCPVPADGRRSSSPSSPRPPRHSRRLRPVAPDEAAPHPHDALARYELRLVQEDGDLRASPALSLPPPPCAPPPARSGLT